MPLSTTIRVEGAGKLRATLKGLPGTVRKAAQDAIADSAQAIKADGRAGSRVDTAHLRDGVAIRRDADGLGARIGVFDDDLYYGQFQEFGTSSIPAKPFMTPAAESERRRLPGRIERAIKSKLR